MAVWCIASSKPRTCFRHRQESDHRARYLLQNLEWLDEELGEYEDDYLFIDCPGESSDCRVSSSH